MRTPPLKLNVVKIVTELDVRQCVRGLYIKAINVRLTTSDTTVLGDSRTYQLGLLVAQQIVRGNPNVLNYLLRIIT
jgi:hypothetical protein